MLSSLPTCQTCSAPVSLTASRIAPAYAARSVKSTSRRPSASASTSSRYAGAPAPNSRAASAGSQIAVIRKPSARALPRYAWYGMTITRFGMFSPVRAQLGPASPTRPSADHRRCIGAGADHDLLGGGLGDPARQVGVAGRREDVADPVFVHPQRIHSLAGPDGHDDLADAGQ